MYKIKRTVITVLATDSKLCLEVKQWNCKRSFCLIGEVCFNLLLRLNRQRDKGEKQEGYSSFDKMKICASLFKQAESSTDPLFIFVITHTHHLPFA